jgi:hypothetical protein
MTRRVKHGGREFRASRQIDKSLRHMNPDYETWGTRYKHILIWRQHHGISLDPEVFIIHHRDENKRNNAVCDRDDGACPVLNCGNLAPMTRPDHIREHKPGRMGGRKIPNRAGRRVFLCVNCKSPKSKRGDYCRQCYLDRVAA